MKYLFGKAGLVAALIISAVVLATHASAESLWSRRDPRSAFLFKDNRARNVGDLLTVMISETTDIDNDEQRNLQKQTTTQRDFDLNGTLSGDTATKTAATTQELEASSNRQFQTENELDSTRTFTDFVTAVVVDVLPNGNLVIEGRRKRVIAGENRTLRLTGIVRPNDILSQEEGNVIESRYVANFHIEYTGKGTETRFTKQGWLTKTFNKIWPF